ncbi:MAG: glutamine synthetase [Gammaproteobacteria bacterium]|nr:MAG: glutamine synthetase [Gammaproteobacteria bacterium]
MGARQVKTVADARETVIARELSHVKVGMFDIDGILRGKHMSREKFLSALDKGFGFCDVVLGWDSDDRLYDNVKYTGWHTGYPDALVRILPESCREIPFEPDTLFFLAEFSGPAERVCPRGVLRRVIEKANAMGFSAHAGFEYEFFVFNETRESIREKRYHDLKTLAPGNFGYSVLRNSVDTEIYQQILDTTESMDFPLESLHEETGPGVLEAALAVDSALNAADKAALFKTFTKVIAQRQGLLATFMAKWSPDWPGQSGHIHISLKDGADSPVFFDPAATDNMSDVMCHFVAGQQKLMPELLAMIAPTINAYSRLVPGFWAPTVATWGVDNRTCALRVIAGGEQAQRVEYRVGAADANPYLILAAALASGLWGIEQGLQPEARVEGNAYDQQFPEHLHFPPTLWDAAQHLKQSSIARQAFGDEFVEHFAASREWEEREFRKHITDWELGRYLEII